MPIYECTVWHTPKVGDPQPIVTDGHLWTRELVAETASKARYSYWRDVHESWDNVKLTDIRVKSLNRKLAEPMADGWGVRLNYCNQVIRIIAKHGRHFLSSNSDRRELQADPFIAHFETDAVGNLWYVDPYKQRRILVRLQEWNGFSDGGTLRSVITAMRDHIMHATPIRPPWGEWWGYDEDMAKVASEVKALSPEPVTTL